MKTVNRIVSLLLCITMLLCIAPISIETKAETTNIKATVEIEGECLYSEAFEVYRQINAYRKSKGLKELYFDASLLEMAMQRAAETAIRFDHKRPDGSSCLSIGDKIYGENIAIAYKNATDVVNGWLSSSMHHSNIVTTQNTSTGIGAFYHNGTYYWVQLFAITKKNDAVQTADSKKNFKIYLGNNTLDLSLSLPENIYVTDNDEVFVTGKNSDYNRYFILNPKSFSYISSNEKVLTTSSNTFSALLEGSSTLTVNNSAVTLTKNIQVKEFSKGKSRKCGDNITWDYNNKTLTLSGSGDMYNYNTQYDENNVINSDVLWHDAFDKVQRVVVNENITSIGDCAFACFNELTSVSLPSTLETIGNKAFPLCKKLESIYIPEKVTSIGDNTFYKCLELTDVTLPSKLTAVPANMFYRCDKLESINIPETVETIGQSAFAYCYKLSSFTLPTSLKQIGPLAFISCESINEITIPFKTESIARKAFADCISLSKVTFNNPTTIINNDSVFGNTSKNLTIYGYKNSSAEKHCIENGIKFIASSATTPTATAVSYTTTYTGTPVTKNLDVSVDNIQGDYFVSFSKGTQFDFSACFDSIEKLSEYWRKNAPYNDRISTYLIDCGTYPISYCVYANGYQPVYGTANIVITKSTPSFSFKNEYLEIPWYTNGNNDSIPNELLNINGIDIYKLKYTCDNPDILAVDWKGNIRAKKYGECTVTVSYDGDNNLDAHSASFKVNIYPIGLLMVDKYQCEFKEDGTATLKLYTGKDSNHIISSSVINSDITTIGENAFFSNGVEELTIPDTVTHIEQNAFKSCYLLNSVTLSDSIETIDDYAFSGCKMLLSVTIPASVTHIGKEAFGYTAATSTAPSTKIEGFTIYGYRNSAAEKYAYDNGFKFVAIKNDILQYELGDVDRDGFLSILDATSIQLHIAKIIELDDEQLLISDINEDESTNILDVTAVQMKLAGII